MRSHRLRTVLCVAPLLLAGLAAPAAAAEPPPYFGTDHDDPRTAARPIDRPDTRSCSVRIVDHEFTDFEPAVSSYAPPADCAGDWSMVVLDLHGAVAGRQFDRLGRIEIGDVPVFKTSTPEPSADGIEWHVEKDVTEYAELLRSPQQVEMFLGNVVNDTYTGILDITVDLTFYTTSDAWPAPAGGPESVQPLVGASGGDGGTTGTLTVAPNTERLVAEVYATGSGGGCEEFWYTAAPTASPDDYWCKTDQGPWRELQVHVDGRLAGIATPYPHIYTGGWSNPFLWYVVPAPRAFDIAPVEVDLTPFVGTLTDGRPHQVRVSVVGASGSGWDVPTGFLSWQDEGSTRVTGAVRSIDEAEPSVVNTTGTDGELFTADLTGSHGLTVTGWADTSHGRVTTTVSRSGTQRTHHWWADGETRDGQVTSLTDEGFVRTQVGQQQPTYERWSYDYGIDGEITITDAGDITTVIDVTDTGDETTRTGSRRGPWHSWRDRYDGEATWNYTVPREQRRGTGWSEQERVDRSDTGCWRGFVHTVNGTVTEETGDTGC